MSKASSTNEAGKKGADHSHGASSTHGGSSNSSNKDKAGSSTSPDEKNQRGSGSNFANDPDRARDAGRKGGEHSHDKHSHDNR
jgi:uncharacterized protein